jgi:hypothetical protein
MKVIVAIILAVAGLSLDGGYTLLFTQNHGEGYDIWGKDFTGFLEFSRLLEEEGFGILSLNRGAITSEVLDGVDAVIVSYPKEMFSPDEMEALKEYVDEGGSLVVFGGMDTINQTNPIIGIFGLEITSRIQTVNGSKRFTLDVPEEEPHPIFTHVRTYEQINTPTVRVVEGPAHVFRYPEIEEDQGLFVIKDVGAGKVLVTADADFLNNVFLHNHDNAQLGVNILSYMAGKPIEKIEPRKRETGAIAASVVIVMALTLFLDFAT